MKSLPAAVLRFGILAAMFAVGGCVSTPGTSATLGASASNFLLEFLRQIAAAIFV